MGCVWSRLLGSNTNNHTQLSDEDDAAPKKQYSWDKREKVDMKNFVLDNLSGETVGRMPGTINGQQFIIKDCRNCDIYVFDHCATVTVDDCVDCRIFIAVIKTSIFVRDCTNCVVATCCQQFRTRDCKKLEAMLCCVTQPIIESTTAVKFGCFQFDYPQLKGHLQAAGLSPFNNNWSNIHDFTPVPGENNYAFFKKSTVITDYLPLPSQEPMSAMNLTAENGNSVVPFTVGVKERPPGHSCLIMIFHGESQHTLAYEIVRQLRESSLVQTAEMSLSEEQMKRIIGSDRYCAKANEGPVVMLEYSALDIETCRSVVLALGQPDNLHVSQSVEDGAREVDCFNNLTEMKMAV